MRLRRLVVSFLVTFVLAFSVSVASPIVQAQAGFVQASTEQGDSSKGRADVKVWVNTGSGVYHCPGTRYYGNTKRGSYMSQAEAQKAGHRPAYGRYCE